MPGLKKEKRNLESIKDMMKREESPVEPTILQATAEEQIPLYTETFNEKIGSATRARYEAGNPPRLHKLLFNAIVAALNGQKKGSVNLSPILTDLESSRGVCTKVLSCLEAYGYLRITRDGKGKGKTLTFEILQDIPE